MKLPPYVIEVAESPAALAEKVNSSIRAGYRPSGSMVAVVPAQIPEARP